MLALVLLVGCENTKHKIGISTKPFQHGEDLEDNTKLNYTIVFGKVRPQAVSYTHLTLPTNREV